MLTRTGAMKLANERADMAEMRVAEHIVAGVITESRLDEVLKKNASLKEENESQSHRLMHIGYNNMRMLEEKKSVQQVLKETEKTLQDTEKTLEKAVELAEKLTRARGF
jgi:hypothetical protein